LVRLELPDMDPTTVNTHIPLSSLFDLGGCSKLRVLRMVGYNVSEDVLRALAGGCSQLVDVEMALCRGVGVSSLEALVGKCVKLRRLGIKGVGIQAHKLRALRAKWPHVCFDDDYTVAA